jgi:hypothetical protein
LEDILHERGHNHSKADYYPDHLFLRVLCHTLEIEDDNETHLTGVSAPVHFCSPNNSANPIFKSDPLCNSPLDIDLEGGETMSAKKFSEQDSSGIVINELDPPKTTPPPPPQDMKPKGKGKDHPGINLCRLALGKRWTGLSGFGGTVGITVVQPRWYFIDSRML